MKKQKRTVVKKEEQNICSICFAKYSGFGNNAEPINSGRCCDMCDAIVIVARINQIFNNNENRKLHKV
jgi:hypothetical protein